MFKGFFSSSHSQLFFYRHPLEFYAEHYYYFFWLAQPFNLLFEGGSTKLIAKHVRKYREEAWLVVM